ncbi:MAG: hypothetical protein RR290_02450 [Clostridia bacterium]
MTYITYLEQLVNSAVNIKLSVPKYISQGVANKLVLVQSRSSTKLPNTILYVKKIPQDKYSNIKHLANERQGEWQLEILSATVNLTGKELLIILLKKESTIEIKKSSIEKRNVNNSLRTQSQH